MEIPNVKELRKSIIKEEKSNKEKLDNLLQYRIETRKKWNTKKLRNTKSF